MPQRIITLDAETYYDDKYSLSKMVTASYILDPRFEMILLAVKEGDAPPYMVDGPDVPEFFKSVNPAETTCITFNSLFDNCIFSWRYGWVPSMMLDVMGMARALKGHLLSSVSLRAVSEYLGTGAKGHEIENVKGMHRHDILASGRWRNYCEYALQDVELTQANFWKLIPDFPSSERRVMDKVLRAAVQPAFHIDVDMLREHLEDLKRDKIRMVRLAAGAREEDMDAPVPGMETDGQIDNAVEAFSKHLRSGTKFETLLKARGVEIEYKRSATGNDIPAFAKTDEFMTTLQEHDDPIVQALAAARLGVRSTIEQTRGQRLLDIASLDWSCYGAGNFMPIPLAYGKAHTHRLAGDWKINMQNLPSGRGGVVTKLRKSLIAPPGHKVLVADLSQIEARLTAWFCRQEDLLQQFAEDREPYAQLGSSIFSQPIPNEPDWKAALKAWKVTYPLYRFIGKTGVLGLGFRCGSTKFYNMVVSDARKFGMDMKALMAIWTPDLAQKSVDTYRTVNSRIRNMWHSLDQIIATAWMGVGDPVKIGPGGVIEIGHGYVKGPGGLIMNYANPRLEDGGYWYTYGRRVHKIHGGTLLENIIQFLDRIIIMNATLRLWDRGYQFRLNAHDELVFIVPDADVDNARRIILEEMRRRPAWGLNLPVDAECGKGAQSYGDAK